MRYIYNRVYDNGFTDVMEVTEEYIKEHGLKPGCMESKAYDAYLDSFETDDEFAAFWNDLKNEGARVVLM